MNDYSGRPVVQMSETEYWVKWMIAGAVGLLLARWVLVQPILDALHR